MKSVTGFEFYSAIDRIIKWADARKESSFASAAKAYAEALPDAIQEYGHQGLVIQINYILANLHNYKGDEARADKEILKLYRDRPNTRSEK